MTAKHSLYDADKKLWVACSECSRGANGERSCAGASSGKKFRGLGCFLGTLLPNLTARGTRCAAANYIKNRTLRIICRELGHQLYRLILKLCRRKTR